MINFLKDVFNDEYLKQVDVEKKLEIIYKAQKNAIDKSDMQELLIANCFLKIINGELENAEKYINNKIVDQNEKIVKLARIMIHTNRVEKNIDYDLLNNKEKDVVGKYQDNELFKDVYKLMEENKDNKISKHREKLIKDNVKIIEEVNSDEEQNSLFVKLTIAHAYFAYAEKHHAMRRKYYSEAYNIVDDVLKEYEETQGEDKKKFILFFNEKGNILLQFADFDKENQPLRYDVYHKIGIYDDNEYEALNREECLEEAERCYNKAIELNDKFAYAFNGLGNVYREKGELDEVNNIDKAICYYSKAIELNDKFYYPLNYIGDCYRFKEMYKEAKDNLKKANEINKKHVYSLYGLGKVCYELGNREDNGLKHFSDACEYFIKALKCDKSFPYAWFDLGRTIAKLEKVEIPNLDLDYILDNIKKVCEQECLLKMQDKGRGEVVQNKYKEELKEKIEEYYRSLEEYNYNLLNVYDRANECFAKKYYFESRKKDHWQNTISYCKADVENKIAYYQKLKDIALKTVNCETDVKAIKKVLFFTIATGIEEQIIDNEKKFSTVFLSNKTSVSPNEKNKYVLHILRRWNSYTPIITDNSKGGGYFIECNGNGIVIDPGHNFIDNFKKEEFKFADIKSIMISHAHDDHTADLESIINLLYRYNIKQLKKITIPRRIAKHMGIATKTIEDASKNKGDLYKKYEYFINRCYEKEKKIIDFYISEEVFIKYSGMFKYDQRCKINTAPEEVVHKEVKELISDMDEYKNKKLAKAGSKNKRDIMYTVNIVCSGQNKQIAGANVHIIKADHSDLFKKGSSLGFVFEFEKTALVYTGDTGWIGIRDTYKKIKSDLNDKEIILLSHIGGFKDTEVRILDEDDNDEDICQDCEEEKDNKDVEKAYYKDHLGRLGLVEINEVLKPKICIISEFGEEFKYNRVNMAKILNKVFEDAKPSTKFIPADIGLTINLESTEIEGIKEIDTDNQRRVYDKIPVENISSGEYKKGNSIFYYSSTEVTENECLQAYSQEYKYKLKKKKDDDKNSNKW